VALDAEEQPGTAQASQHLWRISSVAVLGAFLSQMDATVVNVSLSSLALELHTTLSNIQWVTSGYLLALALTLPLSGWLVDRIGAKALYLWCFSAFTLTSALCGLAWSANSLIGFRILQGMSGGLLAPMAQLIMVRAAGEKMARVFGFAAMPILLAPLLGPVIAGALLRFASWRWLFLVNLPFGALALMLAVLFLPHDRHERRPRSLDVLGLGLLSPGVVLFLYGSEHAADLFGVAALTLSLLLLIVFFRWAKRKKDDAIVDVRLFKDRIFSAAVVTQFLLVGISYSGQMLIPVFLTGNGGLSPSKAGLLLAAQAR
jgi:EmrB/QacA subfamily drug resistance transporter